MPDDVRLERFNGRRVPWNHRKPSVELRRGQPSEEIRLSSGKFLADPKRQQIRRLKNRVVPFAAKSVSCYGHAPAAFLFGVYQFDHLSSVLMAILDQYVYGLIHPTLFNQFQIH